MIDETAPLIFGDNTLVAWGRVLAPVGVSYRVKVRFTMFPYMSLNYQIIQIIILCPVPTHAYITTGVGRDTMWYFLLAVVILSRALIDTHIRNPHDPLH